MDYDKYTRVRAMLTILSHWKESETSNGVVFCNVLAAPAIGTALRLHFFAYTTSELRDLLVSQLGKGTEIEIIGHMRGVYDEKPDITVHYVRMIGNEDWLKLEQKRHNR